MLSICFCNGFIIVRNGSRTAHCSLLFGRGISENNTAYLLKRPTGKIA